LRGQGRARGSAEDRSSGGEVGDRPDTAAARAPREGERGIERSCRMQLLLPKAVGDDGGSRGRGGEGPADGGGAGRGRSFSFSSRAWSVGKSNKSPRLIFSFSPVSSAKSMENESAGNSRSMHMAYAQGKGTGILFLSLF
jgi:hypothetical protein